MDDKTGSDILKIDDAARYLGVTRRWIYRRIWAGDLPASKVGGLYFIRREDMENLLKQGNLAGVSRPEPKTPEPLLKCGYCFRLMDSDAMIGEVCAAEGCETLLCSICISEGRQYCINHVPDRAQLWESAVEDLRRGKIPVLVKASQARLREVNFLQRLQTRLVSIGTLIHPLSGEVLTVTDWQALLEEGDERVDVMRLMNKAVLENEWLARLPVNAHSRYLIPPTGRQKGGPVVILAQAFSHMKTMIQKGFDTGSMDAEDLTGLLLRLGEEAQRSQTVTLAVLGATSGWDEPARRLVTGEGGGLAFSHHWLLVYLNDMEKPEIIYNRLDNRLRSYADLFTPLLVGEETEEVARAVVREMGTYDSFTVRQALQVMPYSKKSIESAFEKLAASGQYALTEVPGLGLAIVRSNYSKTTQKEN
jgi:excisionase family DNA binding protein